MFMKFCISFHCGQDIFFSNRGVYILVKGWFLYLLPYMYIFGI